MNESRRGIFLHFVARNAILLTGLIGALMLSVTIGNAEAATTGLPFTEDFSADNLKDATGTTANWSTAEQKAYLAWRRAHQNVFGSDTTGADITADAHITYAVAFGDVDGDGDLDIVAGNYGQANRLYLNNGTSNPFSGVTGTNITPDAHSTTAIALGDVDNDGDLDVVAGNYAQANRMYLNNGTADPFNGVSGIDITADGHNTAAIALGDMDGDGDLDVVAGNYGQANRLYLNNGTSNPFNGVMGTNISADTNFTDAIAVGDMDGDGDLDVVAGNYGQANRMYLNNGTADPFNGVTGIDITADAHNTAAIALGDMDGDGDLDVVAGNYAQANRLYLNNGTSNPFSGVTGTNITSDAHSTTAIALGDVDNDGDLDVVAGNYFNQVNRLYLNNGTSDSFSGVTGMNITADGHNTAAIALGDVDNDGDLDVAAGNYNQVNRLYLNNSALNPFSSVIGTNITADSYTTAAIAFGDVDNDGDLDVVTGNVNQVNRLYLNNGTANPFSGVTGVDITADAHKTYAIALGDVDNDGDLDVVAGNYGSANRLYLNNGTADPFNGVTGIDITSDVSFALGIELGDIDNDGDLDVVVGNGAEVNRLYLNNGTANPFSGVTGVNITSDAYAANAIAIGDVDGDGDLDVVAGNYGQANRLYLNNGTSTPFSGATGTNITGDAYNTQAIALGDVDGDGDLDVVVGNEGQANRLYLNNGTLDPFSGVTGIDITTDAHDTWAIALGDLDGDGDLDVVVGNSAEVNRLYLNNGTATPFSGVIGVDITADAHSTYAIALGDVDGDGDLDVVAGNGNQANRLYLNNSSPDPLNGVTGANITADANDTRAIALGDVDNDGDLDVVTGNYNEANRLYLNNGTSNPFSGVTGINITADAHFTHSISLGDVDNDGDLDVVAGNDNQANRLYLNNGTANPFSGVTGVNITSDAYATNAIAIGDVDGDGDLDVVAGNYDQANRLYLNNGTATPFSGASGTNIPGIVYSTRAIALGDVDNDGNLDVVAGNYNQANRLYLNNGTADPFNGVTGINIPNDAHATKAIALGDIDNDGDLDVVAGNYNQANRLYLSNGTANPFSGVTGVNITSDAYATNAIAIGDMDGDGDLDVVVGNDNQVNRLYLNNGTATPFNGVSGIDIIADAHSTYALALGDVDGDGVPDIAAGNNGANRLYRAELYQTPGGKVRSLTVDTEAGNILNARLVPTAATPANTSIDWYLTNNGGAHWYKVKPGSRFIFPTTGSDLRWKAELRSLSPHRTPVITGVAIDTDKTAPTVALSTTAPNPTNSVFNITITFSEAVTGFIAGDITVGNGTASNFSGSGASYAATITPTSDGQVTVNVGAGVAQDEGGNNNTAATQLARTYDHTAPVTTATAAGYTFGNWTATSPISVTFTASDGSGTGVAAGYPKYCVDTANTCTPGTSGASVKVACASGSVCTQYVRYYSVDTLGNTETVKSSVVKQDLQPPVTTANPSSGPIGPSQSITLTCSDSSGAGCLTTLYCTGTACVPATPYSAAIAISADTILRFKSSDTLGNTETVKEESYTYDGTPPVFSALSPAAGSIINAATVGYTLSEVVSSGSVTFTWLNGTTDTASPHAYTFVASDKTAGSHNVNTALPLVSGAYYDIAINAADIAGNSAAPATISNVLFDSTAAVVTITSPAASSRVNTSSVSYTLSEELTGGDIVFTRTSGSADPASPHLYTLNAGDVTAGSHTASAGFTLVNGAVYTVSFSNVTDKAGNPTAIVSNVNVTFDSTAVVISNTTPAPNNMITSATAGYTLSEAAQSGKVTFSRTGGTGDSSSPHVYTLTGSELASGAHTVNTGLSLVEGAIYTVSFEATDMAGNPATAVSNASVTYLKLGDLDSSGDVTSTDALRALRIAAGLIEPTSTDLLRGDASPLVNGKPQPDGQINIGDVVVILRKSVGLVSW